LKKKKKKKSGENVCRVCVEKGMGQSKSRGECESESEKETRQCERRKSANVKTAYCRAVEVRKQAGGCQAKTQSSLPKSLGSGCEARSGLIDHAFFFPHPCRPCRASVQDGNPFSVVLSYWQISPPLLINVSVTFATLAL
jgi:hypothetical protein